MITVTIVPAQSPTCLARPVCSAHRSVQRSFAVMVKAVPANGSRSTRAKVTRSQSLPGCGSTPPHTIVTQANGRRGGKRFIGHHADLRRDILLGCESTIVSAVLSGFLLTVRMRCAGDGACYSPHFRSWRRALHAQRSGDRCNAKPTSTSESVAW